MSTRASIMLAGEQSTRIDVHGARENGARLALLWGTLLLTFTAADQVHALLTAYTDAHPGSQRLSAEVNPAILSANVGDEAYVPTIALTYRDVPRCTVTVHATGPDSPGGWAHPQRFLHITPESSCSASSTKPPTPAPSRSSPTPPIYQGPMPAYGGYCAPVLPPSLGPCQRGRGKVGPARDGTSRTRKETSSCLSVHRAACRMGSSSARTPRRVGAV